MKRRRKKHHNLPLGELSPKELRIHREMQLLRAEGLTRSRKPSMLTRARADDHHHRNRPSWAWDRWRKLQEGR